MDAIRVVFGVIFAMCFVSLSAQDVMLQGWYWDYESAPCDGDDKWATTLDSKTTTLANAGFTYVWLPPASKGGSECSVGYDPKDLYDLGDHGATRLGTRSQLNSLLTAIDNNGMQAVADVVYNHRDGGDYEDNPAVRAYVMNYAIPTTGCNSGITPYPLNGKVRWRLPIGGSSGNTAGDYYFKFQSASENSGFYGRGYKLSFQTSLVRWRNLADITETEPNGGGDCGTPTSQTLIDLGRNILASTDNVGSGECGVDEFLLQLNATDYNSSGDFLEIYIEQIGGDGTGLDIYPYGLYAAPRSADIINELALQTRTDFSAMPSGQGNMNYTNFKPNGTDPTCLQGDWDFPYFFFDVDQRTASTQAVYNEWTKWLIDDVGFSGGLRMDAVKHFDPSMVTNLLNYLSGEGIEPSMVVGEIFDTGVGALNGWVNSVNSGLSADVDVRAFDFSLRQALKDGCDQHFFNTFYDLRNVYNASMVAAGASSFSTVTFVNNHDYRKPNEPVQADPILAYAYILTNNSQGLPCVFYPDFFGEQPPNHPVTDMQAEITELMGIHSNYIFGASDHDYLNAFGTGYASAYNSGNANQCLIYQIRGGVGGEDVIVAINFDDEPLQVDHQINTSNSPIGTQFEDLLGNSNFPYALVSANSPTNVPSSVYLDLPARSYSVWASGAILPAELSDFRVQKVGSEAILEWETSQEVNVKQFEIERSADGKIFTTIATQTAQVNSNELSKYRYVDQPLSGVDRWYYRLRILDVDGSAEYSSIRSLNWDNELAKVWPNPVKEVLSFDFPAQAEQVRIYRTNGQLYQQQSLKATSGTLHTSSWQPGLYQLVFELENGTQLRFRLVK